MYVYEMSSLSFVEFTYIVISISFPFSSRTIVQILVWIYLLFFFFHFFRHFAELVEFFIRLSAKRR